jgi:two-component system KDP operon response regulator KdpE
MSLVRRLRVLLVDDEPALTDVLEPVLSSAGHQVSCASTASDGIKSAASLNPDVILLDLGLPDMDGKQSIAQIRTSSSVPIIVISARHQEAEKIAALDAGADDYVNKPFEIGELMARMRAAVRRHETTSRHLSRFKSRELEIDFGARTVRLLGQEVKLSPKEFDLLATLANQAGQVVTHKRLLNAGWGGASQDTQYLRTYMALLRQKLEEDPSEPRLIVTEPGVGYRLKVNDV